MKRQNFGSGYPFEETYGYSRAVRVNDHVYVSGTTARGEALAGDAYVQACTILGLIESALAEAGAEMRHVVRTVVYVTDLAFQDASTRRGVWQHPPGEHAGSGRRFDAEHSTGRDRGDSLNLGMTAHHSTSPFPLHHPIQDWRTPSASPRDRNSHRRSEQSDAQ